MGYYRIRLLECFIYILLLNRIQSSVVRDFPYGTYFQVDFYVGKITVHVLRVCSTYVVNVALQNIVSYYLDGGFNVPPPPPVEKLLLYIANTAAKYLLTFIRLCHFEKTKP